MKFREINVKTFKGYKETKIHMVLKDFVNSEIPVAEMIWDEDEYKNATSAYSAVYGAIKRLKLSNISVRVINKKLYIMNNILYEKALQEV